MPGTTEPSCTTAQAVVKSSIDILNVPGVQHFFVMGNNDVIPKGSPLTHEWLSELGAFLLERDWLSQHEMASWVMGGYFWRMIHQTGLCAIGLNSNHWTPTQVNHEMQLSQLQWLPGILSRSGESSVCTRGFLIVSHIGIVCPEVPIYSRPRKHAHEPDGAARGAAAAGGGEGTAAASEERGGGEGSVGETAVMELRSDATTLRADGGATAGVAAAVGEGDGAFGALAVASGGGLGGSGLDGGGFGAVGEGAATVWEELKKKTSKTDVHDADEKSGKGKKEKKKGDKGGKEEYGEEAVVNDELWGEDKSALVHCMETRAILDHYADAVVSEWSGDLNTEHIYASGATAETWGHTAVGVSQRKGNDPGFKRVFLSSDGTRTLEIESYQMKRGCSFSFGHSAVESYSPHFDHGISASSVRAMLRDETLLPVREANAAPNAAGISKGDLDDEEYTAAVRAGQAGCLAEGDGERGGGWPGREEEADRAAFGEVGWRGEEAGDERYWTVEGGDSAGVADSWGMPEPAALAASPNLMPGMGDARVGHSMGMRLTDAARSHSPAPFSGGTGPGADHLGVKYSVPSLPNHVPPQPHPAAPDDPFLADAAEPQPALAAARAGAQISVAATMPAPAVPIHTPTIAGSSVATAGHVRTPAGYSWLPAAGYLWLLGISAVLSVLVVSSRVHSRTVRAAPQGQLRPYSRPDHRTALLVSRGTSAPAAEQDCFSPAGRVTLLPHTLPEPVLGGAAVRAARSVGGAAMAAVNITVNAAVGARGRESARVIEEEEEARYVPF